MHDTVLDAGDAQQRRVGGRLRLENSKLAAIAGGGDDSVGFLPGLADIGPVEFSAGSAGIADWSEPCDFGPPAAETQPTAARNHDIT